MSVAETMQWATIAEPPTPEQELAWVQEQVDVLNADFMEMDGHIDKKYGQKMQSALMILLHYAQDYSESALNAIRKVGKEHPVYIAAKLLDRYSFLPYYYNSQSNTPLGFSESVNNSFRPVPERINKWVTSFGAAAGYAMVGDLEGRLLIPHQISHWHMVQYGTQGYPNGYILPRREITGDPYKWWKVCAEMIEKRPLFYESMIAFCGMFAPRYCFCSRNEDTKRFVHSIPLITPEGLNSPGKFSKELGDLFYEEFERRCLKVLAEQRSPDSYYLVLPIIRAGFWQLMMMRGFAMNPADNVEASRAEAKAYLQTFYDGWKDYQRQLVPVY